MAEKSGENGAVYWNEELSSTALAESITYNTSGAINQIVSSDTGAATGIIDFETCGYTSGMLFTLTGASGVAAANNRIYTISAVSCGTLTVTEDIDTSGIDTGTPTFSEADLASRYLDFIIGL